jgi:ribosomal protein S7
MFDFNSFNFRKILMVHGKQSVAFGIICDCFFYLNVSFSSGYFWSVLKAIEPVVEIRTLRRGGRIYFVPFPLSSNRAFSLARRWAILRAKKRKASSMGHCLALEFKDICLGLGGSVLKRNQNQAQALANRGNVGFRWLVCRWGSLIGRAVES